MKYFLFVVISITIINCSENKEQYCASYKKFPKLEITYNGKTDTILGWGVITDNFGPDFYEFRDEPHGRGKLISRYPENGSVLKNLGYSYISSGECAEWRTK